MSRPQPSLKALEVRKQLLIAEAEVLRTRMGKDLEVIQRGLKTVGTQAKSIALYASFAGAVVPLLCVLRGAHKTGSNGKSSLISRLFTGVRAASTVWLALCSRQRR